MPEPLRLRLLGCHHTETATARLSSYLVNERLALDAGALSSTLTQEEQDGLAGIFVTHLHFDHCRDLLTAGLGGFETGISLPVYGAAETLDYLQEHFLNGVVYPDFTVRPSPDAPRLRLTPLTPWREREVAGLKVMPIPMNHGVPAWGIHVESPGGASLLYTGDTGGGLEGLWSVLSPDALVIETTFPSDQEALAKATHHLTPRLLEDELRKLLEIRGSAPRLIAVHMHTRNEAQILEELAEVAARLGVSITPGREGMVVEV